MAEMDVLNDVGQSPTVMALISMFEDNPATARAICRAVMEKDNSLDYKPCPRYRLSLEADTASLAELQELQMKQDALMSEYAVKLDTSQRDYLEKLKPLNQLRYELVAGVNGSGACWSEWIRFLLRFCLSFQVQLL